MTILDVDEEMTRGYHLVSQAGTPGESLPTAANYAKSSCNTGLQIASSSSTVLSESMFRVHLKSCKGAAGLQIASSSNCTQRINAMQCDAMRWNVHFKI